MRAWEQSAGFATASRLEAALASRARFTLESTRRAAVAIMLREDAIGRAKLFYIQRTARPEDPWSGQMAFPGGRVEASDAGPFEAALRETEEEIGVDLRRVARAIGAGDDIRAMARGKHLDLVITPFVFVLEVDLDPRSLLLQADEVAEVILVPLEGLASGAYDAQYRLERPGMETVNLPCFEVGGKVIWGLTYMMTRNLLDILERSGANEANKP
jgi:8-oxo-dGTP pyrophosphatase MutT (NUDIX family)